jgi:hypothetical protein
MSDSVTVSENANDKYVADSATVSHFLSLKSLLTKHPCDLQIIYHARVGRFATFSRISLGTVKLRIYYLPPAPKLRATAF